jgi:hypothetical protein
MPKQGKGWLRRKVYAEGETWLFCYDVPRPGNRPAEHTKIIGLVKEFPKKADAEREAQRLGLWKLVHPTLSISPTFGELAQHFRVGELKRNGALSRRAAETIGTHESMLDGYILPRWASVRAVDRPWGGLITMRNKLRAATLPSHSNGRPYKRYAARCHSSLRMRSGIVF